MQERRGFGSERMSRDRVPRFIPKPVKVGEEYEVDVVEKSRRGEGVAKIEGLVIFIPNAKPGDHIKVRIMRISRKFAEAQILTTESS